MYAMSDTIEYEKKQLEILYQELTGKKYETVCLLEAAYYGWLVYGMIHYEKLGVDCYKMINPVVEKGKTAFLVIDKALNEVNEAMLKKDNPGYDGYYVNKGSDNERKWEYLEFMYLQSIEDFPEFLHELYKKVQEMSHVFEAPVGKSNIEKYF